MKKLIIPFIAVLSFLIMASPTPSSAAYDASSDTEITIVTEDGYVPSGELADSSFQLQEDAHALFTDVTGIELDHSYVWITVNGVPVLAIDPIKPTF